MHSAIIKRPVEPAHSGGSTGFFLFVHLCFNGITDKAVQASDAVSKLRRVLDALEGEDTSKHPTWKRVELERMKQKAE